MAVRAVLPLRTVALIIKFASFCSIIRRHEAFSFTLPLLLSLLSLMNGLGLVDRVLPQGRDTWCIYIHDL